MNIHMSKQRFVVAAILGALAVFAVGFFVALAMRSAVAGPDSAPAGAPPNPGHEWSEIGLPPGTWPGLDADTVDGLHASEIGVGRAGFSRTTVDSAGNVGCWYTSVTVGADGLPVISYHDHTNGDLKVAHCDNAACTSATTTTVDSAGDIGNDSSVTVEADGLPVISYLDYTNADLKVAHCDNAACTSATTTTVDSAGDVGNDSSVTVGADGLPVISYHDTTNGDLKVAHCDNAACTSAAATTVDSTGDIGSYTSVTVGADGLPVISYYDHTNGDLKVAHCSNRFCVPYHRPR